MLTILAAILALSISSDKIDTFMHLPDWFPTSVDAEHTFGSDEHTNCTHRTTIDTLASVESVFDAYHERVFYTSDSFPPNWDSSVYGPKPAEGLQTLWFTNTLETVPGCFVYPSWTNTWPRATPESRRLLEFTNVFTLAKWIPGLFRMRTGCPWLDKGETWGTNRTVMFASSWGPGDKSVPDDVPWTDPRPLGSDEVDFDSMIPLCYCSTDTVFVTEDFGGKDYGLVYRMLSSVDRTFNALGYGVTNAAGETVKRGGILGAWDTVGFSNSVARATTVPGIITNRFPFASPEVGMTNVTRRLIPDDMTVPSVTNIEVELLRKHFSERASSLFNLTYTYRHIDPVYGVEVNLGYRTRHYPEYRRVFVYPTAYFINPFGTKIEPPYTSLLEVIPESEYPEGTERVEVENFTADPAIIDFSEYYDIYDASGWVDWGYRSVIAEDSEVSGDVVLYGYRPVTNTVASSSSILATESRALAMLDRTYELGPFLATNGPRKAELTRYRADARNEGEVTVTVESFDNFPFVDIVPITLDDIPLGTPVYQKSNSVEDVREDAPFTREFARFSGETASGSISFSGQAPIRSRAISAADVLAKIPEGGMRSGGFHSLAWELFTAYGSGDSLIVIAVASFYDTPFLQSFQFDLDIGGDVKVSKVPVSASVTKTAWYAVGDRLPREFYDNEKNISRVAPGPQAYVGGGRVAKGVVELFSGMLFMRSYVDYDRGPLDSLWFPNMYCASLPYNRPYDDEELDDHPPIPFEFESSFRIRGEEFTSYSSVPGKLYAARDDVRTLAYLRVAREIVGSSGSMSSAEDVVPIRSAESVFTELLVNNATVSVEIGSRETGIQVDAPGNPPRIVDAATGETISGGTPIAWVLVTVDVMPVLFPSIDRTKLHPAVAVDGRVEPVIVTDWNWKALKSERNNQ